MKLAPWLLEPWRQLQARRSADRLPHALLLATPAGLGKRSLAKALQASLLCSSPDAQGFACGHCRACQFLAAGSHADAINLTFGLRDDGKVRTEIVVDQIRALCERFAQTSARGGWRVAIIDPADALNHNAANALLKTLEEPETGVLMILVADDMARLPATIRSRCQRIDIAGPNRAEGVAWLLTQGAAADDAASALDLADGNPGEALLMLAPEARRMVSALIADIAGLAEGKELAPIAARWSDEGADLRLRTLARLITAAMRSEESASSSPELQRMAAIIVHADFRKLSRCWDKLNWSRGQLSSPLRSDLLIIDTLVDLREALR
ncbi:MAG: DNA polymerase III subunit delta' [Pseudomonadota bacterium]|nr:DNA polymerase III subunit delta' [Pseudomonadota bacterium]